MKRPKSKQFILMAILLIAIGTVINNVAKIETQTLGIVLYGVGGLFLVMGLSKKKEETDQPEKQKDDE